MSVTPGMEFEPKYDWVDVADPNNPPSNASKITANDLKRYEQGLEDAEQAIDQTLSTIADEINTQLSVVTEDIAESALWPDASNPGLYWFRQGGQLVPSGTTGLYDIDPNFSPMPNYEIPNGVIVQVMEANNTYVRPTNEVNVVCTFVGVGDPITIAFNGDRWDKVPTGTGESIIQFIKINGTWV